MTDAWKLSVRQALAKNATEDRAPRDQSELAEAIRVHKTAITKMFKAQSSALVDPICSVLRIDPPMIENRDADELSTMIGKLDDSQRIKALDILKAVFGDQTGDR